MSDDGTTVTFNANSKFAGTGRRIEGDFSAPNHADRLLYMNSNANSRTIVGYMPSIAPGSTWSASAVNLYGTNDAAQTSAGQLRIDVNNFNATVGDVVAIRSFATCPSGQSCLPTTPPTLPISFQFALPNTNETEAMRIMPDGKVGIGTTAPGQLLEVAGTIKVGAIIFSGDATATPQNSPWTGAVCADFAESVDVTGERAQYEPGDVLIVEAAGAGSFVKSSMRYATTIAGVYSTKPGLVGRRTHDEEKLKAQIPMAVLGIVPTKVSAENGAIRPGDLLVTSSTPGHAMKGTDRKRMLGAILGKALGSLESGTGTIEVLISVQ